MKGTGFTTGASGLAAGVVAEAEAAVPRGLGERCCATALPVALSEAAATQLTQDLDVLAHPIRLRLLSVLAARVEPTCVCDFEMVVPVKQPTISHHLKVLREAGLVEVERRGLWAYYQIDREAMRALRARVVASLTTLGEGT